MAREPIITGGQDDVPPPRRRADERPKDAMDEKLRPQKLSEVVGQRIVAERLAIALEASRKRGEPLPQGDVTARITAPSGQVQTIRFQSAGDEWGAFSSHFTPEEPGRHEVILSCRQTSATLETSFYVQGAARERLGRGSQPTGGGARAEGDPT